MLHQIKGLLADEPVNRGRQLEVDIAKAEMVLMLPFIHCIIECTTDEGLCSGIPYFFDTIIGGPFSAPMYLFAMGICLVYSRRNTPRKEFLRGLTLIGVFYLNNTCRFLIPYLVGYQLSGDREQFIEPLFYRWLGNDVLLFAGMAMMVIALFRHYDVSDRAMLAISAALSVTSSLIGDVDAHSMFGNIFLGYFIGTDDATGLVISDFPLMTWLIFPVAGYVFGKVLIRVKEGNKSEFYLRISPIPLTAALIYFPIGIHFGWGMFGEGQNCYYHMMIWDVCICLCLDIGMLGVWYALSNHMGWGSKGFLTEVSANITAIYCIHWVFVRSITNVYLYIKNGTQILPLWQTMLLSLAILIVTLFIAHYYKIGKARYKANRANRLAVREVA